jgi:hypothetical protein
MLIAGNRTSTTGAVLETSNSRPLIRLQRGVYLIVGMRWRSCMRGDGIGSIVCRLMGWSLDLGNGLEVNDRWRRDNSGDICIAMAFTTLLVVNPQDGARHAQEKVFGVCWY